MKKNPFFFRFRFRKFLKSSRPYLVGLGVFAVVMYGGLAMIKGTFHPSFLKAALFDYDPNDPFVNPGYDPVCNEHLVLGETNPGNPAALGTPNAGSIFFDENTKWQDSSVWGRPKQVNFADLDRRACAK